MHKITLNFHYNDQSYNIQVQVPTVPCNGTQFNRIKIKDNPNANSCHYFSVIVRCVDYSLYNCTHIIDNDYNSAVDEIVVKCDVVLVTK